MRISIVAACLGSFLITSRGSGRRWSGALLVWASASAEAATTATAAAGRFSILSMNVAGLPQILQSNDVPGDKTTNAKTIGSLFAAYDFDVIHVQEDFNYHAYIYSTDDHPFRTATSGGAGLGSGLNTLSNFDWVDFTRVKWDGCSDASENDCLTPKGFTFMRALVASSNTTSVYVDLYNLHTDAGTEDGDESARNANLQQVADYIARWSAGNAVIVFGDTNSRYSRVADTGIRALLSGPAGLTDAWVELERGGTVPTAESLCDNPSTTNTCETVDKVLYRSSPLVNLTADAFQYASTMFLQPDGAVLSDHNPVNVNFTWRSDASVLRQSGLWGGPHGTAWFSDVPTLAGMLLLSSSSPGPAIKVSALTFRGASRLDAVAVQLGDGTTLAHGGTGGTAVQLVLDGPSEYWAVAELCQGQRNGQTRNFYIAATTSKGRTLVAGTRTADCVTFTAPDGWQIVGFLGQDGDEMDQLGFVYAPLQ